MCGISSRRAKGRSVSLTFGWWQASDFYYLTGFDEPDAALVLGTMRCLLLVVAKLSCIESRPSTSRGYKYTLFVPPHDSQVAQWSGQCTGLEGATTIFQADEVSAYNDPISR